jgi:hypothetical protein
VLHSCLQPLDTIHLRDDASHPTGAATPPIASHPTETGKAAQSRICCSLSALRTIWVPHISKRCGWNCRIPPNHCHPGRADRSGGICCYSARVNTQRAHLRVVRWVLRPPKPIRCPSVAHRATWREVLRVYSWARFHAVKAVFLNDREAVSLCPLASGQSQSRMQFCVQWITKSPWKSNLSIDLGMESSSSSPTGRLRYTHQSYYFDSSLKHHPWERLMNPD